MYLWNQDKQPEHRLYGKGCVPVRQQDTYKEVRTLDCPGWKIRVHIPDLTEEERARRMKQIEKAAFDVIVNTEARRREREASLPQ